MIHNLWVLSNITDFKSDQNPNNIKGILLRWDKLSISSMYLLNLSISGLLFSLTMPIWILQIISGQV